MAKLSQSSRKSLEEATARFQSDLAVDEEGQQYLLARGVTPDAAGFHRLGVVRNPPVGYEDYLGRLAIPYLTPTGVIDIRFRALNDIDTPKYLTRPGGTAHLYNVGAFSVDTTVIAVTEGELDALTAHSLCGIPAVGVPGANNWKHWWARAFHDYDRVLLICDGDEPGREWGKALARDIEGAVVIHMPQGMDVNKFYLAHGRDETRKRCGL